MERLGNLACLILALAVLSACGSTGSTPDDRSFANDPTHQTAQATSTLPPTRITSSPPTPTPPAPPAALLVSRGAPSRFYVAIGGQLLEVSGQGTAQHIALPKNAELYGFDWSPNGERVAVAVGERDSKTGKIAVSLLVFDHDGKTTRTVPSLLTLPASGGTPAADSGAPRALVDWGLVENQIAVVTTAGALVLVPASGEPKSVAIDLKGQVVRSMRLSPRGDAIALLTTDAAGRGTVSLVSLADGKTQTPKPLVGYATDTRRSITAFAWLSDSQHLVYTQAHAGGDPRSGGELYVMNVSTKDRRLIDTGGRAGPAAGIISFAPSPDGKSVAYVIGVQESSTWVANSLWVRSLRGSGSLPVPIGNAERIDGLWWTPDGLVWAVRVDTEGAAGSYQVIYVLQPPDGPAHELLRVAVKHGAPATPTATPVASPGASPIASPRVTPKASPIATPGR